MKKYIVMGIVLFSIGLTVAYFQLKPDSLELYVEFGPNRNEVLDEKLKDEILGLLNNLATKMDFVELENESEEIQYGQPQTYIIEDDESNRKTYYVLYDKVRYINSRTPDKDIYYAISDEERDILAAKFKEAWINY